MDDLSGLDWSSNPASTQNKGTTTTSYPTLRPTPPPPLSGRSTPLSALASKPTSKPPTPANDSFSNLVSFGSTKNVNNLSLQERQRQIQEQKRKEEAERREQLNTQFLASDNRFWDGLGASNSPQKSAQKTASGTENDNVLSAFSPPTAVDQSRRFQPPPSTGNGSVALDNKLKGPNSIQDDDPFDLKQHHAKIVQPHSPATKTEGEDDVLGLLGKPVSELPKPQRESPSQDTSKHDITGSDSDRAAFEIVDMGFPIEKARAALATTENGTDVQAAVGWLLSQAHQQSRQRNTNSELSSNHGKSSTGTRAGPRDSSSRNTSKPAWMDEETSDLEPKRTQSTSPANGEKDISKIATEVGSNLFKTANSLWNTSRKKVQKAVQELQQEGDPNQPKWMREAQAEAIESKQRGRQEFTEKIHERPISTREQLRLDEEESRTDEALRLELGDGRPPPWKQKHPNKLDAIQGKKARTQSPGLPDFSSEKQSSKPAWMSFTQSSSDPRAKLSRQAVEEQSSQAYISPARRKKPITKAVEPELHDLFQTPRESSSNPFRNKAQSVSKPSTPIPTRPKAPYRAIPPTSSYALQTSSKHRLNGTEAFKRGDYASAHSSYSSALSQLPDSHPIAIIVLTNRALTSIKVGEPKSAVSDADRALAVIGISQGDGEIIDAGSGEGGGKKDMRDFFGKALLRKAEALEAMEKWHEAHKVWSQAVEAGVGGSIAIQGRNRCEKASGKVKAAKSASQTTASPRKPQSSALNALSNRPRAQPTASTEAVTRLRAANAAADAADDEKFALSDAVDAKLTAWKGGKTDNLRALLGSLDTVLWPEAGWKKIGMADLIIPGKVKIHYMKGIAKVHPDKLPTTATVEQKMISGAVFSTLNEAWDKFKKENGL